MESLVSTRERPIWQEPHAVALLLAASLTTMANATISPALPGIERLFAGRDRVSAVVCHRSSSLESTGSLGMRRTGRHPVRCFGQPELIVLGAEPLVQPLGVVVEHRPRLRTSFRSPAIGPVDARQAG